MLDLLTLGSAVLHSTAGRGVTHVEGLIGPPGARGDFYNRPEQDGAVAPFKGYMPSRLITIEGFVKAGSIDATWSDWQIIAAQFEAALAGDVLLSWRHQGGAITLQQSVRLADQSQPILSATEPGLLRFQVVLRAADPRWESSVQQTSTTGVPSVNGGMKLPVEFPILWGNFVNQGACVATNGGTTTCWPVFTLTGPLTAPQFACTTQAQPCALTFTDTLILNTGDSLVVDTHPSTRSATLNGIMSALGSLNYLTSKFYGLRPGVAETIQLTGTAGSAATLLSVAWRNSYLG